MSRIFNTRFAAVLLTIFIVVAKAQQCQMLLGYSDTSPNIGFLQNIDRDVCCEVCFATSGCVGAAYAVANRSCYFKGALSLVQDEEWIILAASSPHVPNTTESPLDTTTTAVPESPIPTEQTTVPPNLTTLSPVPLCGDAPCPTGQLCCYAFENPQLSSCYTPGSQICCSAPNNSAVCSIAGACHTTLSGKFAFCCYDSTPCKSENTGSVIFGCWRLATWVLLAVRLTTATSMSWFVVAIPFDVYICAVMWASWIYPDVKVTHGRIPRSQQCWSVGMQSVPALLTCTSINLSALKLDLNGGGPALALCFIPLYIVFSAFVCLAAASIYMAASYSTSTVDGVEQPEPGVPRPLGRSGRYNEPRAATVLP